MAYLKFKSTQEEVLYFEEVKREVTNYFIENKISSFANAEMMIKTIFWILFWAASWYAIILAKNNFTLAFSIGLIHMFSHVMIAFNITHDANHFAMFKKKSANHFFGYLVELLGCNRKIWLLAHNREHHTYINIHEYDNNIEGYKILRLTPEDKWYSQHKYQWLYAPFIYCLTTLNYALAKDYKMIFRYSKMVKKKIDVAFAVELIFFKLLYYSYMFIIPIVVFGLSWKLVLSYFIIGHLINGLFLTTIFVIGHQTENTSYPVPVNNTIPTNWAVHVVKTTGDFATKTNFLQWLVGGINLHVAHHLFPQICHVHYKAISPIIKRVTLKHGIPYREIPSFRTALKSHISLLKSLGRVA